MKRVKFKRFSLLGSEDKIIQFLERENIAPEDTIDVSIIPAQTGHWWCITWAGNNNKKETDK